MSDEDEKEKLVIWAKGELEEKLNKIFEANKDKFLPIPPDGKVEVTQKWPWHNPLFCPSTGHLISDCTCGAYDSRENLPHSKDCPDYVDLQAQLLKNLPTSEADIATFKVQVADAIRKVLTQFRPAPDFKVEVTQDPDNPTMFTFSYEIPFRGIELNLEVPDEG